MSEAENLGSSVLKLEYKEEEYSVPLIANADQLKNQIQTRLLPVLRMWQEVDPETEIAVSEYVYFIDESLEGQTKRTEKLLKNLNVGAKAEKIISRRKGFFPVLSDRLSWRRDHPEEEIGDEFLPFENRTFIIGSMAVDPKIFESESGPTFEQDVEASSFFTEGAVAVDGKVMMEAMGKKLGEKVTNLDLVKMIEVITRE